MGSNPIIKEKEIKKVEVELRKNKDELKIKEDEIDRKEKEMKKEEISRNEIQKMKEIKSILDYKREKYFPNTISLTAEQTGVVLFQMTHSLCKILNNDKGCGTGFFVS